MTFAIVLRLTNLPDYKAIYQAASASSGSWGYELT